MENKEETECGFGLPRVKKTVQIPCLQNLASPLSALILLSLANLLLQTNFGRLYSAVVSTLEKRFQLHSQEVGLMIATFNFGQACSCFLILSIGENIHKPRWIGLATFIQGIGALVFALPHFIATPYEPNPDERSNLCGNVTEKSCEEESIRVYKTFFIITLAFIGFTSSPIYTYAIPYLDEICPPNKSALYNAVFFAIGGAGPAVGFLLGGIVLEVYTNIENPANITSSEEAWIGAWWLGFIILCPVVFVTSILIYMLPKRYNTSNMQAEGRASEVQHGTKTNVNDSSLPQIIYVLMKNFPFMLSVFAYCVNMMFLMGFSTFGAKYMEVMFGLKPFLASIIFGTCAIIASFLAQLTSGIIISKLNLNINGLIKFTILCSILSTIFSCGFFIRCPEIPFNVASDSLISTCNENCGCITDYYEPVCNDNVTYFSPCHAGCTLQHSDKVYGGCLCSGGQVIEGKCETRTCTQFIWWCILIVFAIFTSVMTLVPFSQIRLRCVSFDLRVRAIALSEIVVIVFGIAGGRYLTGKIVDLACDVWQTDCGQVGSCVVYNNEELAKNTTIMILVENVLIVLTYILLFFAYKPSDDASGSQYAEGENGTKVTEQNSLL